jgi:hypothetical protein
MTYEYEYCVGVPSADPAASASTDEQRRIASRGQHDREVPRLYGLVEESLAGILGGLPHRRRFHDPALAEARNASLRARRLPPRGGEQDADERVLDLLHEPRGALVLGACLVPKNFPKNFQNFRHINFWTHA